jgi:hypothetical protein
MKFVVEKEKENILVLVRRLGYRPLSNERSEFSCVKTLTRQNYPRFHLYVKEGKGKIIFNLHLDQKKPSYAGASAHSGEYNGEIIESEAQRIINLLKVVNN